MKYCFGVDIGGTTVKLGLFTTEGEIVDNGRLRHAQRIRVKPFFRILPLL